ncbi:acyltransferase family protein [Microbacterium sp. A204]|uniref:acyltransferase family protein n=1 Tax=Microbacterium sp. A204 TaxID=3457321 RepID=UPI003FD0715A
MRERPQECPARCAGRAASPTRENACRRRRCPDESSRAQPKLELWFRPDLSAKSPSSDAEPDFVISGFLITSLLLRPSRLGRLGSPRRLVDFWRRRARRLIPALAVVVTVCATAAWMLGGDLLVGMGRQVRGAAIFSYNWLAVADGTDYFAATAPELFRNFWSLAVEEQFYVVWPLLLPLVLLIPGRWPRVALMLVAAGGSASWMAQLVASRDVTRAYFGTDAHAFGLLIGIALALAVTNMSEQEWMRSQNARAVALLGGVVGLSAIVVAAAQPSPSSSVSGPVRGSGAASMSHR